MPTTLVAMIGKVFAWVIIAFLLLLTIAAPVSFFLGYWRAAIVLWLGAILLIWWCLSVSSERNN